MKNKHRLLEQAKVQTKTDKGVKKADRKSAKKLLQKNFKKELHESKMIVHLHPL